MVDIIRYKLRMLGVPLLGPACLMCDNASVVYNGSFPESTLKKKHVAISYHCVREFVAANKGVLFYKRSKSNIADLFTKVLPPDTHHPLIQSILL